MEGISGGNERVGMGGLLINSTANLAQQQILLNSNLAQQQSCSANLAHIEGVIIFCGV